MNVKNIDINLSVGQTILVKGKPATINKIEYHERTGEIELKTSAGPRKALTFQLLSQRELEGDPAERYR
jgi:hypothetical protein